MSAYRADASSPGEQLPPGVPAAPAAAETAASRLGPARRADDLDEYVYEAMKAGASGFLLKDVRLEQLAEAVRVIAAGEALLSPAITRRLIEEFGRRPAPGSSAPTEVSELTDRELDVLKLVARRTSNAGIASTLFVSEATVKTHMTHILSKLRLRDRVQAVVLAYESGLVRPGVE
jgi:DNA-binding NarL/FixJ family response regulator